MGRAITGNAYESRGKWYARVSIPTVGRVSRMLPWCTARDAAETRAKIITSAARSLVEAEHVEYVDKTIDRLAKIGDDDVAALDRAVATVRAIVAGKVKAAPTLEDVTFGTLAGQWTSGELHKRFPDHVREKRTSQDDIYRLEAHVLPVLRDVPVRLISIEHAEQVMARLPAKMRPATRRAYAQVMARLLNIAVTPLRLIKASPLPRGWLPKLGASVAFTYLRPTEDASLLGCTTVPILRRLLFGFLAREGMRRGEALALTWTDVDLAIGAITLTENKTDDPRTWALGADVVRALKRWREMNPDETRVFPGIDGRDAEQLAVVLRNDLATAGVKRTELFERSAVRRPLRVHDLRASFITLALASGRTETFVADRTGHQSSDQINTYRRQARAATELRLGWFGPLDVLIPELAPIGGEVVAGGGNRVASGAAASSLASISRDEVVDAQQLSGHGAFLQSRFPGDQEVRRGRTGGRYDLLRLRGVTTTTRRAHAVAVRLGPSMSHRPRVLIVDDNPDVGRMLTLALRAHYDCFVETSATRALDLVLGGQRFDAIVLDLWMPGTNGMEAYETIAERAPAIASRVVFITGGGLPPRMHAFAKRFDALPKPLKMDVLRAAIDRRVGLTA